MARPRSKAADGHSNSLSVPFTHLPFAPGSYKKSIAFVFACLSMAYSSSGSRMPSIRQRVRPSDRIPSRGSIVGFGCFLPRRAPSPYTNYLSLLPKTAKRTNQRDRSCIREGEWSSRGVLYASYRRSKGLSCYPHRPKAPVSNFAWPGLQLYVGRSRLYGVLG